MTVTISNRQRKTRLNTGPIEKDCLKALDLLSLTGAELSLLIVGHSRMRQLNRQYRGVDRSTDVLSFPMYASQDELPASGPYALGDIVINAHRAQEQAREAGHSLKKEVRVLLVHGLVHLLGLDHEKGGTEAQKMKRLERRLLKGLGG